MASGQSYQTSASSNLHVANAMVGGQEDIARIRGIVTNSAVELSSGYRGADGASFQELLGHWTSLIQRVENGLREVETTMRQHTQTQGAHQEDAKLRVGRAAAVYGSLAG